VPGGSSNGRVTARAFSIYFCRPQEQETLTCRHLALPSALLAFTFAFVAATTAPASDNGSTTSSATFSRKGGGGGGPTKPLTPVVVSREQAEEDVRKMEEEALQNPYTVSAGAIQGARWTMEDAYSVENGGRFAAVFDGHGGSEVSSTLRDRLYNLYHQVLSAKHWEERDDFDLKGNRVPSISSHVAALRGALEQVEQDVLKHDDLVYQGSTAVAVVLHVAEGGQRTMLSANIGDSRAVLSRGGKAIDLTRDHKPNDERERARIRAMGEEVQWDPYGQLYRVRDLSLSRAIGDRFAKPAVSSEAEIQLFPVTEKEDEFVLLASDGLWDVMTSQEAVDFVHDSLTNRSTMNESASDIKSTRKRIARIIANEALERGSADNVCVLVVWLNDHII